MTSCPLQFDRFDMEDMSAVLPGLTDAQQRGLGLALRYWKAKYPDQVRDIQDLIQLLSPEGIEELRSWSEISSGEATALNERSAAVVAMKLARVINEAKSFYTKSIGDPTYIYTMIGSKLRDENLIYKR